MEALGEAAVAPLCEAMLTAKDRHVRWGAAKALGALRDPRSAPALVDALEDRDSDVAWLAAVALENMGRKRGAPCWVGLIDRGVDSVAMREGAHHVFSKQKAPGFDDLLDVLREALEFGELTEAGESPRPICSNDCGTKPPPTATIASIPTTRLGEIPQAWRYFFTARFFRTPTR